LETRNEESQTLLQGRTPPPTKTTSNRGLETPRRGESNPTAGKNAATDDDDNDDQWWWGWTMMNGGAGNTAMREITPSPDGSASDDGAGKYTKAIEQSQLALLFSFPFFKIRLHVSRHESKGG
jgi:hypothetical protein